MFSPVDEATRIINLYNNFVSRVEELGLLGAPDARPLLDVGFSRYLLQA